jgi:hypothetical protein
MPDIFGEHGAHRGSDKYHPGFPKGSFHRWLSQAEVSRSVAYGWDSEEAARARATTEYWDQWDGKLYHGTTAKVARKVLADTLRPRSETGADSNWKDVELQSHPDHIYLSKCYAPYFAASTYANNGYSVYDKRIKWAIIEVDMQKLDVLSLRPDEDLLAQVIHQTPDMIPQFVRQLGLKRMSLKEKTAWFRENMEYFSAEWRSSLVSLGHIAHKGAIPKDAITRIVLFQPSSNHPIVDFALDPNISPMNFSLMRQKYDALTEWFMGEDVDPNTLLSRMSLAPSGGEYAEYLKTEVLPRRDGLESILEKSAATGEAAMLETMQAMQLERMACKEEPPSCFTDTVMGSSEPGNCNWLSSIWNMFAHERGVADDSKKYNPYLLTDRPKYSMEREDS